MSNSAAYITKQRMVSIQDLSERCGPLHQGLSGSQENFGLQYKSQAGQFDSEDKIKAFYLGQFSRLRRREMELGSTLSGPHKDDIVLTINQQDTRFFASEGQQRSCIASLRLAEWQRLKSFCEGMPLMIIDDVGMSLDNRRKENFIAQLDSLGQVFLSMNHPLPSPGKQFLIQGRKDEGGRMKDERQR